MKRKAYTAFVWTLITFVGGLMILLAMPRALGGQSMAVLSGSMSPAVRTGDEIVVMPLPASELKPGEIAVFNDPEDPSRLLNHRVQSVIADEDKVSIITLGDSNSKPERWAVPPDRKVGKVVARVPWLGYLLKPLNSPKALLALLVLPALVLCVWFLVTIWRLPEGPVEGEVAGRESPR